MPILIVEDQKFVAGMFKVFLAGHKIHVAHDGARALAIIEQESPNLIITDIELPDMSGFDILRRARAADIPVIVLTGSESYAARAIEEGAALALTKPVTRAALLAGVKAVKRR